MLLDELTRDESCFLFSRSRLAGEGFERSPRTQTQYPPYRMYVGVRGLPSLAGTFFLFLSAGVPRAAGDTHKLTIGSHSYPT